MNYYSVERSTDHLAHYGVKGMRWGVRKAIATGNQKAVDKHFRKAAKKLAKLQDIGLRPGKYAAKSAAYGAAAAGVGTLAVGGTNMAGDILSSIGKKYASFGKHTKAQYETYQKIRKASDDVKKWGNKNYVTRPVTSYIENAGGEKELIPGTKIYATKTRFDPVITGNTIYRTGVGLVTVGLAAKSAQNAYRAKNSDKYREKAANWKAEMDDAFRGTKYEGKYILPPKTKKKKRR